MIKMRECIYCALRMPSSCMRHEECQSALRVCRGLLEWGDSCRERLWLQNRKSQTLGWVRGAVKSEVLVPLRSCEWHSERRSAVSAARAATAGTRARMTAEKAVAEQVAIN